MKQYLKTIYFKRSLHKLTAPGNRDLKILFSLLFCVGLRYATVELNDMAPILLDNLATETFFRFQSAMHIAYFYKLESIFTSLAPKL